MRTLTNIDLRLIRIFRAIVECQGLSNAECVLHLSQSRISAGLGELEERLGVCLCRRGRAGFSLTQAGAAVYEASHELFEAADRFCNRAAAVSRNLQQVLRLGTVDAVATQDGFWLATALRELRAMQPGLIIDYSTGRPSELESQLVAGGRDVIVTPSFQKNKTLSYRRILAEKQSLYCSSGHHLFERKDAVIGHHDLERASFVARGYLHRYDLERVGHGRADAIVETMEAQLVLILTGEFIGYLPAHYAAPWVARRTLRCINDVQLSYTSPIYAVTLPRSGAENPSIQQFLSIVARLRDRSPATHREPAQPLPSGVNLLSQ